MIWQYSLLLITCALLYVWAMIKFWEVMNYAK